MRKAFSQVLDELAPAAAEALFTRAELARDFAECTPRGKRRLLNLIARRAFSKALSILAAQGIRARRHAAAA